MDLFPVRAIVSSADITDDLHRGKRRYLPGRSSKKTISNEKVIDLVLQTISDQKFPEKGSLLGTAEAPKIVTELFHEFLYCPDQKIPKKNYQLINQTLEKQSEIFSKFQPPIGIQSCDYNPWINALMQLVIFISSISETFIYTSQSLTPFIDFIDTYRRNQLDRKKITMANSRKLLEALRKKFPGEPFKKIEPFKVLDMVMQSISSEEDYAVEEEASDLMALHPSWRMYFSEKNKESFEGMIEKHSKDHYLQNHTQFTKDKLLSLPIPNELLIGLKSSSCINPKRVFQIFHDRAIFELDAFVEYRKENSSQGSYIAYIQLDQIWFQCDDTRVIPLREAHLPLALRRSVILHYKKRFVNI